MSSSPKPIKIVMYIFLFLAVLFFVIAISDRFDENSNDDTFKGAMGFSSVSTAIAISLTLAMQNKIQAKEILQASSGYTSVLASLFMIRFKEEPNLFAQGFSTLSGLLVAVSLDIQ